MSFKVNEFTAEMNKNGAARADHFEMTISGIPAPVASEINFNSTSSSAETTARGMTYRIESTMLPGRTITPVEYKDYGVPYKIGGLPNYVDIEIQVILSEDLRERNFFLSWQDYIVGAHRTESGVSRGSQFDTAYYDEYKCDGITITQYSSTGQKVYEIQLIEAYPLVVGPVTSTWGTVEYLKQPVTFTYRYFTETPGAVNVEPTPPGVDPLLINALNAVARGPGAAKAFLNGQVTRAVAAPFSQLSQELPSPLRGITGPALARAQAVAQQKVFRF